MCGSGKKYKKCCLNKYSIFNGDDDYKKVSTYDIYQCLIRDDYKEDGLAGIQVVRKQPNDRYSIGIYLIDMYCLGLKDTFSRFDVDLDEVKRLQNYSYTLIDISYEKARSIVLGGIEYADKLGFVPHKDWEISRHIIEDDRSFEKNVEFGKNGKPLYIQGPNDNAEEILKILDEEGANYLIQG
jgi:hypothetical protein